MHFKSAVVSLVIVLGWAGAAPAQEDSPNRFAIENVTIVDVVAGRHLADRTVIVSGNRIAAMGPSTQLTTARMRVIDGNDRFLIPGLWEMHAHALQHYGVDYAYGMEALQLFVANGVTGVRDAGSSMDQIIAGRKRVAETGVAAPRISAAGPILEGNAQSRFAPFTKVVTTPAEGRLAVTALRDAGVDWIKIHDALTRETYLAVADEAAIWGMDFSGHVPDDVTMVEAARAGQTSLEHLGAVIAYCTSGSGEATRIEDAKCETGFSELASLGTFLGPTLLSAIPLTAGDPRVDEERLRHIQAWKRATWPPLPNQAAADSKARYALSQELTRMASEAGVRLIVSTDTGAPYRLPGFATLDELEELVEAGVSTLEALRAGTLYPVVSLGLEPELGTVEPGKLADLVLLEGDPLEDIRNLRQIAAVVADGRVFEGADREALLVEVRNAAAAP
jgi:imidazolonepropionase-like amidohydrolase